MKFKFVKLDLTAVVNDFKEFTFAKFYSERYYLHFGVNALICAFAFYPLAVGFFVTVLAVFREWYYATKNKDIPFDWADIRWTAYGSIFTFLIKTLISLV
jgi:hypothetical protein